VTTRTFNGLTSELRTTLPHSNLIEPAFSIVETVYRNVKRWQGTRRLQDYSSSPRQRSRIALPGAPVSSEYAGSSLCHRNSKKLIFPTFINMHVIFPVTMRKSNDNLVGE
jgi:hypothetical protein